MLSFSCCWPVPTLHNTLLCLSPSYYVALYTYKVLFEFDSLKYAAFPAGYRGQIKSIPKQVLSIQSLAISMSSELRNNLLT